MSRHLAAAVFGALCLSGNAARVDRSREPESMMQANAEELSDGAHVCCLEGVGSNFKVSVYHAGRGQGEVSKCLLTSIADGCGDQSKCMEACAANMKVHRRYHDLLVQEATKAVKDAQNEKDKVYRESDRAQKQAVENAQKAFDNAVRGPRRAVDAASKELASKRADFEEAQAEFNKTKASFDAAQAELNARTAARTSTEQQATQARTRTDQAAQSKSAADKQAADSVVAQRTKALDDASKEAAKQKAAAVPVPCQDSESETGAQDCCCSINKQAVRVAGDDFVDWDQCKGAQAYSKTSLLSLPCGYFTPCNKCAELICGKGMCP